MWRFDAWSVRDGLAFVSDRKPDTIESRRTVFLTVPDLEPVPVGRISTALRATRASFQDGFRDPEGNEFGFESLEEVREVVRRAYLGSGLGPPALEGGGGEPPPTKPFRTDREPLPGGGGNVPDGGAYYEDRLRELRYEHLQMDALAERHRRRAFLQSIHDHRDARWLYALLREYGEATLFDCIRLYSARYRPEDRELLQQWAHLLYALGLWDDTAQLFAVAAVAGRGSPVFHDLFRYNYLGPLPDKAILFRVPCPLRPQWHSNLRVLAQKLLLPLCDRSYFVNNPEVPEFIPLLLCSLVIVVTSATAVAEHPDGARIDRHRLLGRALEWIDSELPRVELQPEVEDLLTRYAWGLVDLPPRSY
jgi:hypothetical protein